VRSGTRATLSARALDRHGKRIDAPVTWTSRSPAVAAVTENGALVARRRGTAVIVAAAAGVARAVTITVTAPPVIDVVVDGVPPVIVVGATATLRGVVRTARAVDDDQQHRAVEWKSSDPSVATIAADGVLTARAAGQVVISATCDGVRGDAPVTVVSVRAATVVIAAPVSPLRLGDRVPLKATVYDAAGKVVSRPVTWRSTDVRVAPVDPSGRLAAQSEGWAIVTAQSDGVVAHVEVVVRQQLVPVSASGRRESRRLALYWWVLLAIVAGAVALGWRLLRR